MKGVAIYYLVLFVKILIKLTGQRNVYLIKLDFALISLIFTKNLSVKNLLLDRLQLLKKNQKLEDPRLFAFKFLT